jgi:SAM-dependent methyltransferase
LQSLAGDYYAECQEVFRRSTDQPQHMLAEIRRHCARKNDLRILSVGAGTGLLEIPMLKMLRSDGIAIRKFVGIDIDEFACEVFKKRLAGEFGETLDFEIERSSFQDFEPREPFDLVLYIHVFEYLPEDHGRWLQKSLRMLTEGGNVLIFSPNRGGINHIYSEVFEEVEGFRPVFSYDIREMLAEESIPFQARSIEAQCDVSLLETANGNQDSIKLLSFLTQIDCRTLSEEKKAAYIAYYLSLRVDGRHAIPHPATMFIL